MIFHHLTRGRTVMSAIAILAIGATSLWGGSSVSASPSGHPGQRAAAAGLPAAPPDPYAKSAKKYKGQTIVYYGGSVGTDHDADVALAKAFTKSTGINVTINPMPSNGTDTLAQLQRVFTNGSSSIDTTRIDVVWPGEFAQYLVNLKSAAKPLIPQIYPSLIANDTIAGRLVGIPYQGDFGMLYYRKDLLKKYNYSKPPTTWAQLTTMAKKIQAGEKKSNSSFQGFVFQGNSYEGLTCNALEWVASFGGGTFVSPKGAVTINNPKAKAALTLAQSWVGTIAPKGVTTYQEGDVQNAFTSGAAAFARNWPYMDSPAILKGTKVDGKVGVTGLPHGPGGVSSATVGGWQIAVSKFSKHQGAATEWAKYYASKPVQIWRGTHAGIVPTMPKVNQVASVKKAQPFLATVNTARVTRPSRGLGAKYDQGSTYIFQGVNAILNGGSVSSNVSKIASELKSLK